MARAYCFHKFVALNTAAGTVYMSPYEANLLANDIKHIAREAKKGNWPDQRPERLDYARLPPEPRDE